MPELVGQAIINARQVVPDMPQTLPATVATVAVVTAAGSTLPAGTYACVVTQLNAYGETLYSGETTGLVVGANQGIQVTSPLQPGATTIRAYLTLPGGASGSEQQYAQSTSSPFTISTPLTNAGVPPQLNKAFLPDSDGNLISAAAMFYWLNDGLRIMSRMAGGLLDYCGVQSVINQPLYQIPGEWISITAVWYDGYWMMGGNRANFWRRNTITSSILSQATISVLNNLSILEVYPQPARTAVATALSSPMAATDTVANVVAAGGFVLPFGMMQVDSEIMTYATINGNQFTGLIRGLGGSTAVAHNTSAPVNELNLFWNGKRQFDPSFIPGQSANTLPIPNGWGTLLAQYISGRAKNIEHDGQYTKQLGDDMKASIKEWARDSSNVTKRRQVGPPTSPGVFYGDIAGGLIVN